MTEREKFRQFEAAPDQISEALLAEAQAEAELADVADVDGRDVS